MVIGLDGATFDLVKPYVAQGKLPTIKMLMEGGVYSDLVSTIPPSSPPAWASFMTGKNPGKHGVFDFVERSDSFGLRLRSSKSIKAKSIWRQLSEQGKKCIVVNVPLTYPPEDIRGCIVTGMMTPPKACYVRPTSFFSVLEEIGYIPGTQMKTVSSPEKARRCLIDVSRRRLASVLCLMKQIDWDFCMVVFSGTDAIQHHLWQKHMNEIQEYYSELDSIIAELIRKTKNEANVMLMSDHGFGPVYKAFHINYFLHRLGLLEFKTEKKDSGEYMDKYDPRSKRTRLRWILLKLRITKENVYTMATKLHMMNVLRRIYRTTSIQVPTTRKSINWQKTRAFYSSTIGPAPSISLNIKGREKEGIVREEEYDRIRKFIISQVLRVRDPETGERIVQDAFRREHIYKGPFVSDAPDITLLTANFEYVATARIYGNKLVSEPVRKGRGTHRMKGIFIAYGPDIKNTGKEIEKGHIIDLAPTVFHMFGLKVPEDMDGKVLTHIFNPESEIAKPVEYSKISEREKIKQKVRRLKRL